MNQQNFLKHFLSCELTLKGYFLAVTRDVHEAEDLLQEVSALLWEQVDRYDEDRPFLPWAMGFARLQALKWRRKQARNRIVLSEEAGQSFAATAPAAAI